MIDVQMWERPADRETDHPASPGGEGWTPPGHGTDPTRGAPPGRGGGSQPPPPPRRRPRWLAALGVVLAVVAVVAGGAGAAINATVEGGGHGRAPQAIPVLDAAPLRASDDATLGIPGITARVNPAVVNLTSALTYNDATVKGTGMVLTPSGLVLTNNHVVDGATDISAQVVGTGRTYTATVVGTDATHDVALLRLAGASGLETVSVGDSSEVTVGEPVVAIGNAGGAGGSPTATQGTVSGLHRSIVAGGAGPGPTEHLTGMIQTDARLASGESGGPLVDSAGQAIGMDTATASGNGRGRAHDVSFAIPIDRALSIARQISAGHSSSTVQIGRPAFLGVKVEAGGSANGSPGGNGGGDPGSFSGEGGPGDGRRAPAGSGAVVVGVVPNSPADSAGLSAGDVIVSLGGKAVSSPSSLTTMTGAHNPGETVDVGWMDRAGQSHDTTVTLATGPAA